MASDDASLRIFEDSGCTRFDTEATRVLYERVWCRLARQALLSSDDAVHTLLDEILDAGGADHLCPVSRGGDDRRADAGVVYSL